MSTLPRLAIRCVVALTLLLTGIAGCGEEEPAPVPAELKTLAFGPMHIPEQPVKPPPGEPLEDPGDDPAMFDEPEPGADPGQLPSMRRCRLNVLECQAMDRMVSGETGGVMVWACACGVFSSSCQEGEDGKRSCTCMLDGRPMPTRACFDVGDPL